MHIYIDESGTFVTKPGRGPSSISAVGALIVPEHKQGLLFKRYEKIKNRLPKAQSGEVKGRLLNESAVADVLALLNRNHCIFESVAIDMGYEELDGLERHRAGQAHYLTKDLTEHHHANLVEEIKDLRQRLERMPLQLYVQSVLTIQLLGNIIRYIPAYWAQRAPKEIFAYHWVIDGKEVGKVTDAEDWWSTTMGGLLQSKSSREPMIFPDWVDFSAFDAKFSRLMPTWLQEKMPGPPARDGIDLKLMLGESFRFSSAPESGLELADIVTNATRRALSGNLRKEGWRGVPHLMIHKPEQYLNFVTLSRPGGPRDVPYGDMLVREFRTGGRSLLTRSALREGAG